MKAERGWTWLLVTFPLLCLWCSDRSFAIPIGTVTNPTQKQIDNVTLQEAEVGQHISSSLINEEFYNVQIKAQKKSQSKEGQHTGRRITPCNFSKQNNT